jgi:hypothetical protein
MTHQPHAREHTDSELTAERVLAVVEDFVDSWVCWHDASDDVWSAYERWRDCEKSERGLAFATYRAALDREEQAARVHCVWTDRLRAAKRWMESPAEDPGVFRSWRSSRS